MNGYTKLFGSILDSSVWQEPDHVRLVWVTMLAMADRNGHVEAAVPGLAARARVPIENCIDALKRLMDKDEYSRTPDNDGRRIVTIDGGWLIINHAKYRAKMSEDSSATNTTMGYVYYAGTKTGDKIRIGWSKNPWARIKERQKSNPDIVLIGTEQGTMDLKIARLISFKAIDSEWVTANADLINHINSLRSDAVATKGDCRATETTNTDTVATGSAKAEADTKAKAVKKARTPRPANDVEFLESLRKNPAYALLNIETELAKMEQWCSVNRRVPSRRTFVNWLNRAEKPMHPNGNGNGSLPQAPRPIWKIRSDLEAKEKALVGVRRTLGQSLNADNKWEPPLTGGEKVRVDNLKTQIQTLRLELETAPV